jgi:hypothetical protein
MGADMTINSDAYFDEKYDGARLHLTDDEKASVLRVPETGNGIPRRKIRGDRNQCCACDEYFNSSNAFDQHRTGSFNGNRRCLTVVEMQAKNFGKTKDDFWLCPVAPKDRERLNRIRNTVGRPMKKL